MRFRFVRSGMVVASVVVGLAIVPMRSSRVAADDPSCAPGMVSIGRDPGQCCYPGQRWDRRFSACVGVPSTCPDGRVPSSFSCSCPTGTEENSDTHGHCCFPGQAWSSERVQCIGTPECPADMIAEAETCTCADGRVRTDDTGGHCCYPGQAWSSRRQLCVGRPTTCPSGLLATADGCTFSRESIGPELVTVINRSRGTFEQTEKRYANARVEGCVVAFVEIVRSPGTFTDEPYEVVTAIDFRRVVEIHESARSASSSPAAYFSGGDAVRSRQLGTVRSGSFASVLTNDEADAHRIFLLATALHAHCH